MTASLAGFIEFIRAQPVDRPLYHDSWQDCAVGDYARENGMNADDTADALAVETGSIRPGVWGVTVPRTSQRTLMDELDNMRNGMETYGDLQKIGLVAFGY